VELEVAVPVDFIDFLEENEEERIDFASQFERNPCLAHLLQLGIRNASDFSMLVKKLSKHVNEIVAFFGRSSHFNTKLMEKTSGISLVRPCITRWNALFSCFNRIISIHKETQVRQADSSSR
jgi:hypothetical protein